MKQLEIVFLASHLAVMSSFSVKSSSQKCPKKTLDLAEASLLISLTHFFLISLPFRNLWNDSLLRQSFSLPPLHPGTKQWSGELLPV